MSTIRIKGLNTIRSKGRVYIYLGRGVGATRIYRRPGTPEFFAEIAEAKSPFSRMDKSRLRTWVALYRASDEFKDLADSTKNAWLPWLDRIQAHFGDLRVRQFDKPRIRVDIKKWRDKWRVTPRTADYAKQVLSRVLAFAVSEGALQK